MLSSPGCAASRRSSASSAEVQGPVQLTRLMPARSWTAASAALACSEEMYSRGASPRSAMASTSPARAVSRLFRAGGMSGDQPSQRPAFASQRQAASRLAVRAASASSIGRSAPSSAIHCRPPALIGCRAGVDMGWENSDVWPEPQRPTAVARISPSGSSSEAASNAPSSLTEARASEPIIVPPCR